MSGDPAALVDSMVESARFGAGELVVETGRGTLRYRRVRTSSDALFSDRTG